jgi:hypothetical protein
VKGREMSRDKTRTGIANLFVMWSAIFLVVSAVPEIPQFWRIAIYVIDTLTFTVIGARDWQSKGHHRLSLDFLFRSKTKSRLSKAVLSKIIFWLLIYIESLEAFVALFLSVVTWEIYSVNGVAVVTYGNLRSILSGLIGALLIIYLIYQIRKRKKWIAEKEQVKL